MRSSKIVVTLCVLAVIFLACSQVSWGQDEIKIVSPSEATDVEGDRLASLRPSPNGTRVQELQLATDFLAIGSGPFEIGSLALRPDKSVSDPYSFGWDITELNLSTTAAEPGRLSTEFEKNIGQDVTTVFSGTITFQTDGSGPPNGPRDFDYLIEFDRSFTYDPNEGNLLVDWVFGPDTMGGSLHDALSTGTHHIIFDEDATARFGSTLNRVSAMQFSIVPEPTTFILSVTSLLGLLRLRRKKRSAI